MSKPYFVRAELDAEAGVWVATADDVPGLVTEAMTIEALDTKPKNMVSDLLEANGCVPAVGQVAVELLARRFSIVLPASARHHRMGYSVTPAMARTITTSGTRLAAASPSRSATKSCLDTPPSTVYASNADCPSSFEFNTPSPAHRLVPGPFFLMPYHWRIPASLRRPVSAVPSARRV